MGFVDPVRLCTPCATVTKQEGEFFDTHLKLLFAGLIAVNIAPMGRGGVVKLLPTYLPAKIFNFLLSYRSTF